MIYLTEKDILKAASIDEVLNTIETSMHRAGVAPAAIINLKVDPILALGSIVSDELYHQAVPIVVLKEKDFLSIKENDHLTIKPDGTVKIKVLLDNK